VLDIVIEGGQLVDGTGGVRRPGDVGIRDGRVVALGTIDEPARRRIDADGAVVAPGFVDPHTHVDAQVFWDPMLSPSTLHGITTVVAGNCGFTVAPVADDGADYLMRMLSRVEGMPLTSLREGIPWGWSSTAEYLDRVDHHTAANVGFMVGHSALRRVAMGDDATLREARAEEIAAMADLLRAGLAAGGLGFSSSLAEAHTDADGRPVPSRVAATSELLALADVCGERPGTVIGLAPHTSGSVFPEPVADLMVQLSVRAGRPLVWNLLRASARNREEVHAKLDLCRRATDLGATLIGLVLPVIGPTRLTFASGYVLDLLPGWEDVMTLPASEKLAVLRDPVRRAELGRLAAQDGPRRNIARWERYVILECFTPETRGFEGRTVEEIARAEGKQPFDALVDIVVTDGLRTSFGVPVATDTAEDWDVRRPAMRDPHMVVGASDAGAHLDMIDSFAYTTQLLAPSVRAVSGLTIEEIVHLITKVPAGVYGMRDRGVLCEGAWADVVVFDELAVGCGPVHTRHDLPGGAGRLYAESTGVAHVLANGEPILEHGSFTGAIPGRVLRSGVDTATSAGTAAPAAAP
jgi:N-acyl-D-aspartate/D-glutamate deacylase